MWGPWFLCSLAISDGAGAGAVPRVPPKIFTFWDRPQWPASVEQSIDTWRRQNPQWEVQVQLQRFRSVSSWFRVGASKAESIFAAFKQECFCPLMFHVPRMPKRFFLPQVITPENMGNFLSSEALDFIDSPAALEMRRLGPTHFSDLVRVELLVEQGGLWLDATVALSEPVDRWVQEDPLLWRGWYVFFFSAFVKS